MCSLKTLSPGRNRLIVGTLKSDRLMDEIYLENIDRKKLLGFSNWVMKVIQNIVPFTVDHRVPGADPLPDVHHFQGAHDGSRRLFKTSLVVPLFDLCSQIWAAKDSSVNMAEICWELVTSTSYLTCTSIMYSCKFSTIVPMKLVP
jgi:hypothetical protein